MINKSIYFITIVILLQTQAFADDAKSYKWGDITNNIQMSINLASNVGVIKTNEPVILFIRLRNLSTNDTFLIYEVNGVVRNRAYSFDVISSLGKNICPNMDKINEAESGDFTSIAPNQTGEFEYNLSQICKFNEIGNYKITAQRKMICPDQKTRFKVMSNTINVTIVSGK